METYIALFLLIMPGYLAKIVNGHLCDNIDTSDKFRLTMEAMLYDSAIMPIVYVLLHFWTSEIDNVKLFFSNMGNTMVYGTCAIIISILVGIAWKWLLLAYQLVVNFIRGDDGNEITIGKSIYDINFNDGKVHLVEVYKEGNLICRGYLSKMYFDNKEILLEDAEEVFDEMEKCGKKSYKNFYVDFDNALTVKEIDMTKYEN